MLTVFRFLEGIDGRLHLAQGFCLFSERHTELLGFGASWSSRQKNRVGLTPEGVRDLARLGHIPVVETGVGVGSGYKDEAYSAAGATIVPSSVDVWDKAELVVKMKEPQPQEFALLRRELTLFTYLHLAAAPDVTEALVRAGTTAIAYETVELADGALPLLTPMSQIAGRMAPQVAARWLQHPGPGRGKLLSGLPGSPPAEVVLFGAGTMAMRARWLWRSVHT